MDTSSYLSRLESLLGGLPAAERQYAIAYYTEYLMDAGPDSIDATIAALGTPESLAAQIKAEMAMRELEGSSDILSGSFGAASTAGATTGRSSASGNATTGGGDQTSSIHVPPEPGVWEPAGTYNSPPASPPPGNYGSGYSSQPTPGYAVPGSAPGQAGTGSYPQQPVEQKKNSTLNVILIVLLAIFALPIGVPIAIAIASLIIGLVVTVGALIFSVIAVGLALFVSSIVGIVAGIILLFSSWPVGLFYIGVSLILLSVTLMFNLGMFYALRLVFKGIALLFNAIRKKLSKAPETTKQEVNHA